MQHTDIEFEGGSFEGTSYYNGWKFEISQNGGLFSKNILVTIILADFPKRILAGLLKFMQIFSEKTRFRTEICVAILAALRKWIRNTEMFQNSLKTKSSSFFSFFLLLITYLITYTQETNNVVFPGIYKYNIMDCLIQSICIFSRSCFSAISSAF